MNTEFHPTAEEVACAYAVFLAMTLVKTIEPVVLQYQTDILKAGAWRIRPQFAARLGDTVIVDPKDSYLMSDADFAVYVAQCHVARDLAGLPVDQPEQCPLLVAQHLQTQAEHALIKVMHKHTQIEAHKLMSPGLDTYRKYIDLTLRLLAPFVKTTLDVHKNVSAATPTAA